MESRDSPNTPGDTPPPSREAYAREREQRKAETLAEMESQAGEPVATV